MATTAPTAGSFDIGRVLSRGFQTIGNQFLTFTVLALVLAGIPAAVYAYMLPTAGTPEEMVGAFGNPLFWVTLLVTVLLSFVLQAALVRASILELRSEPVELGRVLGDALVLLLPMIGLTIVMFLAVGLGLVLLIVPGIILFIMWIVSVPVLVEERLGVFGSMARSAELTKGSRWWIFLLLIIYLVASSVIGGIVSLAGGNFTVLVIINVIVSTITGVVAAAMLASLYIELRLIKEGGDEKALASIFA